MKNTTALAAALLVGALAAPVAQAQTGGFLPLTWASTMTPTCANAGCTTIDVTVAITGIGADLNGLAPIGINYGNITSPELLAPGTITLGAAGQPTSVTSQGFIRDINLIISGGTSQFASFASCPAGMSCSVNPSGIISIAMAPAFGPFLGSPISFALNMTSDASLSSFTYNGSAYLGNTQDVNVVATNGFTYNVAAYNGAASVVPEPSTYALMATGLVGLGLAARRRK